MNFRVSPDFLKFCGRSFLIVSLFSLFTTTYAKGSEVTIGIPTYVGKGCPASSAEAILVEDGSALTVAYSEFSIGAGPRKTNSSRCKLSIPIQVPSGVRVVITETEFEGFLQLPSRAYATLYAYFKLSQGSRRIGSDATCSFKSGPLNGNFLKEKSHSFRLRTGCGGSFNLEIDTTIGLVNLSRTESASFTIDATNVTAQEGAMHLRLAYSNCH